MAPSEAKKLTISEAVLYLTDRESVTKACKEMNKIAEGHKNPQQLAAEVADFKRALRLKFTGREEM